MSEISDLALFHSVILPSSQSEHRVCPKVAITNGPLTLNELHNGGEMNIYNLFPILKYFLKFILFTGHCIG